MLHFSAPPFCLQEALRYAGMRKDDPEMRQMMTDCFSEAENALSYALCFREFPLLLQGDLCDLGFAKAQSAALARHLQGCHAILLMGATVGPMLDRLILKYGKIAPSRALMLQALGAERIEALCDAFCENKQAELQSRGLYLTDRFSPGYGDLPLSLQKDIFRTLALEKQLGLTLNESMLMSPSKSVTAIIGITEEKRNPPPVPCLRCGQKNCAYRRNP